MSEQIVKKGGSKKIITMNEEVAQYRNAATAINDYLEKSFNFMRDAEPNVTDGVWDDEVKAFVDAQTLKALFFSEDWVFITVDLCASKLSSQRMWVMQESINPDGSSSTERIDAHPLNTVLDMPNQWQDYHSFMYNQVVEYFLEGNDITWWAPAKRTLTTLPTELVTLDFNTDCSVRKYLLSGTGGHAETCSDQVTEFDPRQIIHVRRPNPSSLLWGLSCFVPGRKSVLFNRYSQDYLNSFYLKQALPAMKLEMDKQVNEDVALRQLRSFELAYSGRRNQRRTMILPKGVKADPISHSLADQRLIETVRTNRETILGLLKIPKHELGLQEAGSLGSEEHKVALRNFWEATLIPAARMLEGQYTNFFRANGLLQPNQFFEFDLSDVEALQDDKMKKAEIAKAMLEGGLSVNEVRVRVWDEEPSPDPDANDPFVLIGKSEAPQPQQQSFGTQQIGAGAETIETQIGVDVEEDEEDVQPEDIKDMKNLDGYRSLLGEWNDMVQKQIDETFDGEGEEVAEINVELFLEFGKKAIEVIKKTLREEKSTSAFIYTEDSEEIFRYKADIPSVKQLRRRLERSFQELEELWVGDVFRVLTDPVELGFDSQLGLVINEPNRSAIQALRARDINGRRQLLTERLIDSFAQVSKTHTDRIINEIRKGVERNETINQISQRVAGTFSDPEKMLPKARTIARTETLTAVSIGQQAAMENASEVIPGLKKVWITANDERVRDSHDGLDGKVLPVGQTYKTSTKVSLRFPRDPQARGSQKSVAGEVINCRCTIAMIPPSDNS